MKTKLTDIANIAEVIATIAIVVSLIFVGVQLQNNTRAMKSQSAIAASTATSQWYIELGGSTEASALFRNFMANPDAVSPEERFRSVINLHAITVVFQNNFYLATQHTLDPKIKDSISQAIVVVKDYPGWKYFWKERRPMFLSEFQQYVDELMEKEIEVSSGIYKQSDDE